MNGVNDGGPAFPSRDVKLLVDAALPPELLGKVETIEFPNHRGMSLRDWFAGRAPPMPPRLQRILEEEAGCDDPHRTHREKVEPILRADAEWRFMFADAMIAARAAPTAASGA